MALFQILFDTALLLRGRIVYVIGFFLSPIVFSFKKVFLLILFWGVGCGLIRCLLAARVGGSCSGVGFSLFLLLGCLI